MTYVDGFVLPIPRENLDAYKKLARKAGKIWKEHGALEYRECVGDDLDVPFGIPFTKQFKVKEGETVIFAWIVYKSRSQRDKVNKAVMNDPRMKCDSGGMPFDTKRMVWGGFKTIVEVTAD